MGLCVLYYVEYSLYNVKKVGFFLSGLELHFNPSHMMHIPVENIVKNGETLATSNFSFSQNVFYPIWHLFFILNAL